MVEKKIGFTKMVYGDICQRFHHVAIYDEDVENFEQEILAALEEENE